MVKILMETITTVILCLNLFLCLMGDTKDRSYGYILKKDMKLLCNKFSFIFIYCLHVFL